MRLDKENQQRKRAGKGARKPRAFEKKRKKTDAPKHDRARVLAGAPREMHRPVVADHDLLDEVAPPEAHGSRVVEGGGDLASRGRGEALSWKEFFFFLIFNFGETREREGG